MDNKMKKQSIFSDEKRIMILIELEKSKRKFVELKKILNLESNILSYNLKILIKENLVDKVGLCYKLSQNAKYLMPYLRDSDESGFLPMPCVATIVMKRGEILIREKLGEPEKGKSIFLGGKMKLGEDVFGSCKRHVREKTGIEIKNPKLICINNYISKKDKISNHFIVFFVRAEPVGDPENAKFMNLSRIKGEMFPDNKFIIKNMLNNKKVKMINSVYHENFGKFEVVNVF